MSNYYYDSGQVVPNLPSGAPGQQINAYPQVDQRYQSSQIATSGADQVFTSAIQSGATVSATLVRIRARSASSSGLATVSAAVVRVRALQTAGAAGSSTVATTLTTTRALVPPGGGSGRSGVRFWTPKNPHFRPYRIIQRSVELSVSPIHSGANVRASLTVNPPISIHPGLESEIDALLRDVFVICEACEV